MTSLETLDDDIRLMRDAGRKSIPIPLELAEFLLSAAYFMRAQQGQLIESRARKSERAANEQSRVPTIARQHD